MTIVLELHFSPGSMGPMPMMMSGPGFRQWFREYGLKAIFRIPFTMPYVGATIVKVRIVKVLWN